ncbi:MAG TPA: hypothetical protein VNI02_12160 [Blastocatellia bacterium]|jgi:hypothetical protein|nr:hypothetical protein [Blastocatellia bacterium]
MKKTKLVLAGAAGVLLTLLSVSVYTQIEVKRDKDGFLEGRNWRDGSVIVMTFIRSRTGQDLSYLDAIADVWKKQQEALKSEGIITSYRVLQGNAASEQDFNIILMTEYKDFRAMEENADKQTVILQQIARENQASAQVLQDEKVREFFGVRTVRNILLR